MQKLTTTIPAGQAPMPFSNGGEPEAAPPVPTNRQRVYVIVAPSTCDSQGWLGILADLARRAKGAELVTFDQLFADGADYARRWASESAQLAGAIVVPILHDGRLWVGPVGLSEARRIAKLRKPRRPVLVRLPAGPLLPWAEIEVGETPDMKATGIAAELVLRSRT